MRTIYLLAVFVFIAVLFFYLAASFMGTADSIGAADKSAPSLAPDGSGQQTLSASKSPKGFTPPDFRGPTGQPGMVGPQGPPPNY